MAAAGGRSAKDGDAPADWSQTGTCAGKPSGGWIHSDGQLSVAGGGVCYAARYLGYVEVTVSMKTLDFEIRTALARDSIYRVAETAGLKSPAKKKKDKRISKLVNKMPVLTHSGADVTVTITTDTLSLIVMDTNKVLLTHRMEDISFISGGDADTIDFVGYVGKDNHGNRACHVLECGANRSQQVILTIAQAFELRYKQVLEKHHQQRKKMPVVLHESEMSLAEESAWGEEPTYYNSDMEDFLRLTERPGGQRALPVPPPIPPLPSTYSARPSNLPVPAGGVIEHSNGGHVYNDADDAEANRSPVYENTKSDLTAVSSTFGSTAGAAAASADTSAGAAMARGGAKDDAPADAYSLVHSVDDDSKKTLKKCLPVGEPWFHGKLERREAEVLLADDGDFLVRESTSSGKSGQYVLSAVKNGIVIHLLLVDPEGVVRTKDRTFDSVSHLISYHKDKRVPILSQDLELYLIKGVVCHNS